MKLLALGLVFCVFVSLSHSFCYNEILKPGAKYCYDGVDKHRYPVGSTWTNNRCIRCKCSTGTMECCDTMGTVKSTFPKDCIVEYNYRTCKYKVFHPTDSSIKCEITSAVGK